MHSLTVHQTNLDRNEFFFQNQISTEIKRIYGKADQVWSYLGKIIILTRHLLNAASKSCQLICLLGKDLPERIKKTTTRLKLFSIVSIPFSLISLKSISEKIFKNYLINNKEDVVLGSLSFTIITIDIFDSITTFVNTVLDLSARSPIASLSALGLPFGLAMSGLGTISRIIQIAKTYQVSGSVSDVRIEMFEAFLEKKLGVNEIQAKIAAPLTEKTLKAIPGEIELQLHKLYDLITKDRTETFTDPQISEISQILDDIQAKLKKKYIIEGLGIFANTLIISALCLFCLGSLSSMPFLLLASSFFTRIFSLTYQDLT
ncbi:MAG: hypothetical protein WC222_07080 [Parachlamydiales bacterium]|jgi:hypothetical protein